MSEYSLFEKVEDMNNNIRSQQYGFNGRLFFESNETYEPYELYKNSNKHQNTNVKIISNIVVPNDISKMFFSNENIEIIQREIISKIYQTTNKQIGKQSYQELQIIMKSIYLQYSKNLPYNINEQVKILNNYVIDESVRILIPNMMQYLKYLDDITSPIPVLPRAQNVSIKGNKWGDFSSLIPKS